MKSTTMKIIVVAAALCVLCTVVYFTFRRWSDSPIARIERRSGVESKIMVTPEWGDLRLRVGDVKCEGTPFALFDKFDKGKIKNLTANGELWLSVSQMIGSLRLVEVHGPDCAEVFLRASLIATAEYDGMGEICIKEGIVRMTRTNRDPWYFTLVE